MFLESPDSYSTAEGKTGERAIRENGEEIEERQDTERG